MESILTRSLRAAGTARRACHYAISSGKFTGTCGSPGEEHVNSKWGRLRAACGPGITRTPPCKSLTWTWFYAA